MGCGDGGYHSESGEDISRLQAVILFDQLKEVIFAKILQKLRGGVGQHNETIAMVEKAMQPFIPFLVAEELENR